MAYKVEIVIVFDFVTENILISIIDEKQKINYKNIIYSLFESQTELYTNKLQC